MSLTPKASLTLFLHTLHQTMICYKNITGNPIEPACPAAPPIPEARRLRPLLLLYPCWAFFSSMVLCPCALQCSSHSSRSFQLRCCPWDDVCCSIATAVASTFSSLLLITCMLQCKQPQLVSTFSSYATHEACLLAYSNCSSKQL